MYNISLFSNINGTFQVISIKEKFIEVRNIYNLKFILKKNYDLHLYQLINVNGYLQYSDNIYYIDKPSIVYINNFDVRFYIFKFFSSFKNYKEIVIPITFGYTYSKSTLFENANNIGILHFLIISGLHFNLLNNILKKIFKNKKKLIKAILFLFWILTVWSISSNRAILQKILPNKIKNQKIQKETKLLYISVVCLFLHNSLNVGIGYFISFTLSYLFLFFNQKFKIKEKILFMIFLWIISNLFLVINNKSINILSLFINFFLSIFFECFIIMFLALFWFPFASYFLSDLLYDLVYFLSYFIIHIKIDFLYSKEIFSCVLYGKTMFIMFYYKNNI
ncbi:hypothetical protein RRG37_02705 [Mycoplasmopsis felis]|uniref:hypothetical protein n=1 Tax=Mycoplasmopsis felis TaxID=33923 RepID=UPI002AFEA626|nr:hypothetical protein [Mycoplasmopsis felis]WQQ06257.1 hypothetical protein RRG40_00270 [Mycoplasmopsis felis]